jgi:hypothetical protein
MAPGCGVIGKAACRLAPGASSASHRSHKVRPQRRYVRARNQINSVKQLTTNIMNNSNHNSLPIPTPNIHQLLEEPKNVIFLSVKAVYLPPQFASLYYDLDACPRMLSLSWNIRQLGGDTLVRDHAFIRPEGFTVTDEMTSIHEFTAECVIRNGRPLKSVLQKFSDDVEKYRPFKVLTYDTYGTSVLTAEYVRIGFIPWWLQIPKSPPQDAN